MDNSLKRSIEEQFSREPFARKMNMTLVSLEAGSATVDMPSLPEDVNIFDSLHGGAIFSLIDAAFELACNSHGTVAVALSVNVTYTAPAAPGETLRAEARETHLTRKTASYRIDVADSAGTRIASCQALAYRKRTPLPFALPRS